MDNQSFILTIVAQNATEAEYEQLHTIAKSAKNESEMRRYYQALMFVRNPDLANKSAQIALSDEIPKQAESLRIQLALMLSEHNPTLSWDVYTKNYERLIAPMMPEGAMMMTQITPGVFWNSIPLEQIESWMKSKSPAEVAPFIARGMENARTKLAEKTLLTQATDAYLKGKSVAAN